MCRVNRLLASQWKTRKNNVFIVGGTHGNEPTGVELVHYFNTCGADQLLSRNFKASAIIGNPKAVHRNTRYFDTDLNRCFKHKDLLSTREQHHYEVLRAHYLNRKLGRKGDPERVADMIFDCHNTTADTGILLLMDRKDVFAHQVAQYVQENHPTPVRVSEWEDSDDLPFLPTIGHSGMTVEVGPVPQGCLYAEIYLEMKKVLCCALDFIEKHNEFVGQHEQDSLPDVPDTSMEVFRKFGAIDFPRDSENRVVGMVHQDLQHRDFSVLNDQDPIIMNLDDTVVRWDQSLHQEPVYPYFINEAAYYEKKIAFMLAHKVKVNFPASFVTKE